MCIQLPWLQVIRSAAAVALSFQVQTLKRHVPCMHMSTCITTETLVAGGKKAKSQLLQQKMHAAQQSKDTLKSSPAVQYCCCCWALLCFSLVIAACQLLSLLLLPVVLNLPHLHPGCDILVPQAHRWLSQKLGQLQTRQQAGVACTQTANACRYCQHPQPQKNPHLCTRI